MALVSVPELQNRCGRVALWETGLRASSPEFGLDIIEDRISVGAINRHTRYPRDGCACSRA